MSPDQTAPYCLHYTFKVRRQIREQMTSVVNGKKQVNL